jgi:hypothetical protein|mmetsp:Transcript_13912/g.26940  ORF Transcript_13912/g.26940 Transcript_13912/m.26940 type:complete len:235 (-) Transcript_13912:351-1055(-)|eukprot:CAMPEP_0175127780 /NCGR_PEP_ID=MMETSP0087-20121206/4570_1 /TAXON_ID=136419 /ORGANISM="Unknown Unknown, Strain D1" /LENGTH=234 /DNA_ID=CAMNT_0016409783 /DNA_START=23 /DNA_END=727 /DNA_ORIENTATION=-
MLFCLAIASVVSAGVLQPHAYQGLVEDTSISKSSVQPSPYLQDTTKMYTYKNTVLSASASGISGGAVSKRLSFIKKEPPIAEHATDVKERTFESQPQLNNHRCDKDDKGAIVPGIVVGNPDPNTPMKADSLEDCEAKCNDNTNCNFITYLGGVKEGECILTRYCADFPFVLDPSDGYTSTVMKKSCVCMHRYPGEDCECQHPHLTFDFPNMNKGMASAFDPMNPNANNNAVASR